MYFVDREVIAKRLAYLEKMISDFSGLELSTAITSRALERMCQMMIEVVMDIGNDMIDGFIMRDPGSYEDIIHILVDERVISKEDGKALEKLIPWRKELLQNYTEVNATELYEAFENQMIALIGYPGKIRLYLDNELGPVSAFLPHKE